jgi:hypothetical protein
MLFIILSLLAATSHAYRLIPGIFPDTLYYGIDPEMTYQDRLCIGEAVAEINKYSYLTGKSVNVFSECQFCDTISYHDRPNSVAYAIINGNFNGQDWQSTDCNIYVRRGLHLNICRNVMLHEFLHAAGLDHSDDKDSVMGYHVSVSMLGELITENKKELNWDDILGLYYS